MDGNLVKWWKNAQWISIPPSLSKSLYPRPTDRTYLFGRAKLSEKLWFKVAYYSFSETQLHALRNYLWRHFCFRACNTWRHHQEKDENTSEIWLVEIARGVLLTFFIMNGLSLDEGGERYRYKISVKPWQKPREVVVKILYVYRTRHMALFQRALKLHACSGLLTKEVAKKSQIDFFYNNWANSRALIG